MQKYKILFYDLPDGSEPVKEFLDSLDVKMRAKMLWTIQLLEVNGVELREPYSKALEDGIFELRAKVGSDISRVLYFFVVGHKVISDPEFKKEWDALEPEFAIVQAMIDARKESGLTQKQLSERTGIAQADISKLESGNGNPSVKTLQRLAAGMGMRVKIEFQPIVNP